MVRDFEKVDVFVANAGEWFQNSLKDGRTDQLYRNVDFEANSGTNIRRIS